MILGYEQKDMRIRLYQTFFLKVMHPGSFQHAPCHNCQYSPWSSKVQIKRPNRHFAFYHFNRFVVFILWQAPESAIRVRSGPHVWFIFYGKTNKHHHSTYNVMAFCAVIMLVYQSQQLFNAGFCFHWIALLSLLWFPAHYRKMVATPDRFSFHGFGNTWQYHIAAQILVAPLTLFISSISTLLFCQDLCQFGFQLWPAKMWLLGLWTRIVWPQINQWIVPCSIFHSNFYSVCSG